MRARIGALLATALVVLGGATVLTRRAEPEAAPAEAPPPAASACETRSFEGAAFTVCRFDARRDTLALVQADAAGRPYRTFAAVEQALGASAEKVRFAMNAGMYDEQGKPVGLYVEDGVEQRGLNRREGPGNFHLLPNGVFAQDGRGRVHVVTADRFGSEVQDPRWATQSGPMLVIDGELHPRLQPDGPSRLIRNGVGVSDPRTAWFVLSEEGVSFGRLARLFRDELGCPDALFLDGSVSSLWDPAANRRDSHAELGPIVVVSASPAKRAEASAGGDPGARASPAGRR